jgi:hypothetical protein
VVTIPGPCAAIAALTLAGLPTDRFLFAGFLPSKAKARSETIAELGAIRATLVLYESAPRLAATLAALAEGLGDRDAAVTRDLNRPSDVAELVGLIEQQARMGEAAVDLLREDPRHRLQARVGIGLDRAAKLQHVRQGRADDDQRAQQARDPDQGLQPRQRPMSEALRSDHCRMTIGSSRNARAAALSRPSRLMSATKRSRWRVISEMH